MYNKVCTLENCLKATVGESESKYGETCGLTCSSYQTPKVILKENIPSMVSLLEAILPQEYKLCGKLNVKELTVRKSEPSLRNRNKISLCSQKKNIYETCNEINTITVGLTEDNIVERKKSRCVLKCITCKKCKKCESKKSTKLTKDLKYMLDLDYVPCRAYDEVNPCSETDINLSDNDIKTVCISKNKPKFEDYYGQNKTNKSGVCSKINEKRVSISSQCEVSKRTTNENKYSAICSDCQKSNQISTYLEISNPLSKCHCSINKGIIQCMDIGTLTQINSVESEAYFHCPKKINRNLLGKSDINTSNTSINYICKSIPTNNDACIEDNQELYETDSNISIKSSFVNDDPNQFSSSKISIKLNEKNYKSFLKNSNLDTLNYGKIDIASQQHGYCPKIYDATNSMKNQKNNKCINTCSKIDYEIQDNNDSEISTCYYNNHFQTDHDANQINSWGGTYDNKVKTHKVPLTSVEITSEKSSGSLSITLDTSTSFDLQDVDKLTSNTKSILRSYNSCGCKDLKSVFKNQYENSLSNNYKNITTDKDDEKDVYRKFNDMARRNNVSKKHYYPEYNNESCQSEDIFLQGNRNYQNDIRDFESGCNENKYSNNISINRNNDYHYKCVPKNISNVQNRKDLEYIIRRNPIHNDERYQNDSFKLKTQQCEFHRNSICGEQIDEYSDLVKNVNCQTETSPVYNTHKGAKKMLAQNKNTSDQSMYLTRTRNDSDIQGRMDKLSARDQRNIFFERKLSPYSAENLPGKEEFIQYRPNDMAETDTLFGHTSQTRNNTGLSNNIENYRDCGTYQECRGQPIYNVNPVYHTSREWRSQPSENINMNGSNNQTCYFPRNTYNNGFNGPQMSNTQGWNNQVRTGSVKNINILRTIQKEYEFPNGRKVLKTEITTELDDTGKQTGYGNLYAIDSNRFKSGKGKNNFDSRNIYQIPSTSGNQSSYGINRNIPLSANINNGYNFDCMDTISNQQFYLNHFLDSDVPAKYRWI